jgi:hypothetical protein
LKARAAPSITAFSPPGGGRESQHQREHQAGQRIDVAVDGRDFGGGDFLGSGLFELHGFPFQVIEFDPQMNPRTVSKNRRESVDATCFIRLDDVCNF